ncbi:FecR family protein [Inhella gelatinilytica]|uniref:FecR domain-containing protein n=1 Tax=Inhella gelatinilytica TaxID=2795030 RepID=A0A931NF35_9BURK|nr:FecR family protein [Inhella gelatinilytica]MBH9554344.1 FecR domain-containing protein [Inhella gelatinilytica]
MKHWNMSALVLALAVSNAMAAPSDPPVCEVAALIGEAKVGSAALAVGHGLRVGDEIQTQAKSRLRLRCMDGSSLVLAENSHMRIESFNTEGMERKEARFFLRLGLVGQKVSAGGAWTMRTPSAVTAVRGTEFAVDVPEEGKTSVLMQSGSVDVQPATAKTRSIVAALPVVALAGLLGTDCSSEKGCGQAATWGEARVKALLDRLSGV